MGKDTSKKIKEPIKEIPNDSSTDSLADSLAENVAKAHQASFIEAYNALVKEYSYALQPVIRLELTKLKKDKENK